MLKFTRCTEAAVLPHRTEVITYNCKVLFQITFRYFRSKYSHLDLVQAALVRNGLKIDSQQRLNFVFAKYPYEPYEP